MQNNEIVVQGQGMAINKAVTVAEIIKRQNKVKSRVEIVSHDETDEWAPKEDELDKSLL